MNNLSECKKYELLINKHLYSICSIITIVVMLMFLIEFFTKGHFALARIELFYLGVLALYSFHKELIRYVGCKRKLHKQGELFIYAWIFLTLFLYIVNFFSRGYFSYTVYNETSLVLNNMTVLTVQILAIFIVTRALKIFFEAKEEKKHGNN